MAFMHGSKAKVYGNGYDLSAYLNSFTHPVSVDSAETSTFGNTFKTYVPGLVDATISAEGIYDGAASAVDEVFVAMLSDADDIYSFLPQGSTFGLPFFGMQVISTSYEANSDIGDVSKVTFGAQSNIGFDRGLIYHPLQAEGAGGNTASIDNAAQTTAGGVGYLQVVSGASLIVKVQDSADNSSFADIITFSTFNARGAQRVAITGTVRRYTRVLWTGTGTFFAGFCRK